VLLLRAPFDGCGHEVEGGMRAQEGVSTIQWCLPSSGFCPHVPGLGGLALQTHHLWLSSSNMWDYTAVLCAACNTMHIHNTHACLVKISGSPLCKLNATHPHTSIDPVECDGIARAHASDCTTYTHRLPHCAVSDPSITTPKNCHCRRRHMAPEAPPYLT
jgi:hypothetical protein